MDLTLKQIIDAADDIHLKSDDVNIINITPLNNYLAELHDMLACVNAVSLKLSNIYKICINKKKCGNYKKNSNDITMITKDNDWAYINRRIEKPKKELKRDLNRELKFTEFMPMLTHDIPVNAKIVDDISEIPNIPLYWVTNINQFAIHINGVIFRGNIGNIYNKNSITSHKDKPTNQIIICKHGNKCNKLLCAEQCPFYHDPFDLLQLVKCGEISEGVFESYKKLNRNYINTSWIHTDMPYNKNNAQMRKFGSRNMLRHELELIKFSNASHDEIDINNFRQQCMHDFLVVLGLNQHGLLKEYPDLKLRKP